MPGSLAVAMRRAIFPRNPVKRRSGRSAASWHCRRCDPVATNAAVPDCIELQTDQRIAHVTSRQAACQRQAGSRVRAHVFRAVHRCIGAPIEYGGLHLGHKHPPAGHLRDRRGQVEVSACAHRHELNVTRR